MFRLFLILAFVLPCGHGLAQSGDAEDTTPPSSYISLTSDYRGTHAGPTRWISFSAWDDESGIREVELYVQVPGAESLVPTGLVVAENESFEYAGEDGNGLYGFAVRATDNAGNVEDEPEEVEVYYEWNLTNNGPYTMVVNTSPFTTFHPMEEFLNIQIHIENAEVGGTITVSRMPQAGDPGDMFYAEGLIAESITVTSDGLGDDWTASIGWQYNPGAFASNFGHPDTAYRLEGTVLEEQLPAEHVPQHFEEAYPWLVFDGVKSFGVFRAGKKWAYKGNSPGGWLLE